MEHKVWPHGYLTITDAKMMDGSLVVTFENGDERTVPPAELAKYLAINTLREKKVRGMAVPFCSFDITGDWVRELTDPEYAARNNELIKEQAECIGNKLRMLREARGLNVAEVAGKAGLTETALSEMEAGKTGMTRNVVKVLEAMGCEIAELTDNKPNPEYESRFRLAESRMNKRVGELIRRFREAIGLTVAQVAEKSALDSSRLTAIENGEWKWTKESMNELEVVLDALGHNLECVEDAMCLQDPTDFEESPSK